MDTRIEVRIATIKYGTWENLQVAYDITSVKDLYLTFPTIEVILNYPPNAVRKKIASESLKSFLGRSFPVGKFQGIVENRKSDGARAKVNLLTFDDFIALATWEAAVNGNLEVAKVLAVGFAESFRNLALRQLGVELGVDEQLARKQNPGTLT